MENSNGKTPEKTRETISNEELARVNRRLDVSKWFFAWVSAWYFLSSLMTVGSSGDGIFAIASKWLLVVLVLSCGGLFYSSYAYWGILRWGVAYKTRFLVMLILAAICLGAILKNFWIF